MNISFHPPGSLPEDDGSWQSLEGVYDVRPPDECLLLAVLDDDAGGGRVDFVLLDQGIVAVEGEFGVKDGKKDGKGDSFFSEQRFDPFLRRNILLGRGLQKDVPDPEGMLQVIILLEGEKKIPDS